MVVCTKYNWNILHIRIRLQREGVGLRIAASSRFLRDYGNGGGNCFGPFCLSLSLSLSQMRWPLCMHARNSSLLGRLHGNSTPSERPIYLSSGKKGLEKKNQK